MSAVKDRAILAAVILAISSLIAGLGGATIQRGWWDGVRHSNVTSGNTTPGLAALDNDEALARDISLAGPAAPPASREESDVPGSQPITSAAAPLDAVRTLPLSVDSTIAPGQVKTIRFRGVTMRAARLRILSADPSTSPTVRFQWRITDPAGGDVIASGAVRYDAVSRPFTTTEAGTYTLTITGTDEYGMLRISILPLP